MFSNILNNFLSISAVMMLYERYEKHMPTIRIPPHVIDKYESQIKDLIVHLFRTMMEIYQVNIALENIVSDILFSLYENKSDMYSKIKGVFYMISDTSPEKEMSEEESEKIHQAFSNFRNTLINLSLRSNISIK